MTIILNTVSNIIKFGNSLRYQSSKPLPVKRLHGNNFW